MFLHRTPILPAARRLLCGLLLAALPAWPALAGSMGVSPIRIDLGASQRTGAVTISNDDDKPLRVQVRLMRWEQTPEGKDVYTESDDLIYHPRFFTVESKGQRLVRVGLRTPAAATEQTYRLFIEELPQPAEAGQDGVVRVAIAMRFGIPVFSLPSQQDLRIELLERRISKGVLTLKVRNPGNTHFRLQDITVTDGSGFSAKAEGWYQLAGATRQYTLALDPKACSSWQELIIRLRAEEITREERLPIQPEQCAP